MKILDLLTRIIFSGLCVNLVVSVDNGITDSFVSKEMVDKLGLKRLKSPCPYQVSLLQDDQKIEVKEQC